MALATLSIDLQAKLASFQEGMDKAARLASQRAAEISRSLDGMRTGAVAIGGALAGAFSVSAVAQFIRATVDGVDALNDLADAAGTTVENASALEDIAARTGGSLEQVSNILIKFNDGLKLADGKNDVSRALQAIGLDAEELKRIDPAEALQRTAVALSKFADDGNKARLVQVLYGRSIKEAAPFLKDLAEAGELNATVTAAQAAEAEKFNKQLFALQKNTSDVARTIVGDLLPSMNQTLQAAMIARKELGGLSGVIGLLPEVLKGNVFYNAADGVVFYTDKLALLNKQREAIASDPNPIARRGGLADIDEEIAKAEKLVGYYRALFGVTAPDLGQSDPRELARRGRASGEAQSVSFNPSDRPKSPRAPSGPGDLGFDFEPETESQKRALSLLTDNDLTAAKEYAETLELLQQSLFDVSSDEIPAVEAAIAKLTGVTQEGVDNTRSFHDEQQRLAELLGATATAELERQREDMQLLAQAYQDGRISVEQFNEAAQTRLGTLPDKLKKSSDEMTVFAEEAARSIQGALGSTVKDAITGDFDDIGDRFGDLLAEMAAQAIAAQIGKLLFGDFGQGGNAQLGGIFGSLFTPSAKGNAFDRSGLVTAFAAGGVVDGATPFTFGNGKLGVAGEAGAEGIFPLKRGRDGKLGVAAQGVGGVTVVQHMQFGSNVDRSELAAWGEALRRQTIADIRANASRGGDLAR